MQEDQLSSVLEGTASEQSQFDLNFATQRRSFVLSFVFMTMAVRDAGHLFADRTLIARASRQRYEHQLSSTGAVGRRIAGLRRVAIGFDRCRLLAAAHARRSSR